MKGGLFPARNLLPGDITPEGEVVECLGVAPGCCDVYYRQGPDRPAVKVVRYLADSQVHVQSRGGGATDRAPAGA